jgi:hypothetical protein
LKGVALSHTSKPDVAHCKSEDFTFVAGEPALILSRKRGTERLPNKGLALKHDLGETINKNDQQYQV